AGLDLAEVRVRGGDVAAEPDSGEAGGAQNLGRVCHRDIGLVRVAAFRRPDPTGERVNDFLARGLRADYWDLPLLDQGEAGGLERRVVQPRKADDRVGVDHLLEACDRRGHLVLLVALDDVDLAPVNAALVVGRLSRGQETVAKWHLSCGRWSGLVVDESVVDRRCSYA